MDQGASFYLTENDVFFNEKALYDKLLDKVRDMAHIRQSQSIIRQSNPYLRQSRPHLRQSRPHMRQSSPHASFYRTENDVFFNEKALYDKLLDKVRDVAHIRQSRPHIRQTRP